MAPGAPKGGASRTAAEDFTPEALAGDVSGDDLRCFDFWALGGDASPPTSATVRRLGKPALNAAWPLSTPSLLFDERL